MAYRDFIAVIDLGTSRLIGMVGQKDRATGVIRVLASDSEEAGGAIRRGIIFNIEETAAKIKRLVKKLEANLKGGKIAKVYVGVGGQSLHSIDYSVVKEMMEESVLTEDIKDMLLEDCRTYQPKGWHVYGIVSPTYYVDGKLEQNPVGVPFNKVEVHYKLIVGRPSIRRHIENSIERTGLELAGILISPLALSDAVLGEDEKKLGCALIDFGAGVTSVTVLKGGKLEKLAVIPLGGNLITKDLTSLHLVESEAERIKVDYGNAVADLESDETIRVHSADGVGLSGIKLAEINYVIESRVKEILENVYARLGSEEVLKGLGAGLVITGGGSDMRNLMETMHKRLKMDIRWATLRQDLQDDEAIPTPEYYVSIGLLSQGSINCAYVPPVVSQAPPKEESLFPVDEEEIRIAEEEKEKERQRKEAAKKAEKEKVEKPEKKKIRFGANLFDKIGGLFDDVD
ncbi:cell division protein FtsA [Parabacteroides sp. PFB2-10]|uniref:cell division protein FtsA n=1 Tax=Parabacteroides sp. PFB2-10 TaxID=1742405 RepID=UPI002473C716|nr:cell division protein FtsA [Parabacteroides sp. PFB2-10]